jgi:hypothetical protein
MKPRESTPPKDVLADNPDGTMDRFREGLRRVLAAPKSVKPPTKGHTRKHRRRSA